MSREAEKGFTLVEVLLAVIILAVITLLAFKSLESLVQSQRVIESQSESAEIADAILLRFAREFQLALPNFRRLPPEDNLQDVPHRNESFLGRPGSGGDGQFRDEVVFMTNNGGQHVLGETTNSGVVQLRYLLRENPEMRELGDRPVYTLVREETPFLRPYDRAYEKTMRFPISERIRSLRFDYFDPEAEEWRRDWGDERHRGVPALIRFQVVIAREDGPDTPIESVIPLRFQHR